MISHLREASSCGRGASHLRLNDLPFPLLHLFGHISGIDDQRSVLGDPFLVDPSMVRDNDRRIDLAKQGRSERR